VIKAAGLDWTGECCKRLSIIHTHVWNVSKDSVCCCWLFQQQERERERHFNTCIIRRGPHSKHLLLYMYPPTFVFHFISQFDSAHRFSFYRGFFLPPLFKWISFYSTSFSTDPGCTARI
jgi:hypothetical protein